MTRRRFSANHSAPPLNRMMSNGTKKARYDQPVAGVISANCQSGYHYNCTRMSCACPCGHGIKGWDDPAAPPTPKR